MKITVITPIHGKQKQYGEMIQEIGYKLNEQTIKPFEWIIVCDEKSRWIKDLDIPLFGKILVAERNNISIKRNLALFVDRAKSYRFTFLRTKFGLFLESCFLRSK